MPSPPGSDPTGPDDDDQRWLDLLAGRSAPDALSHTRRQAAWLRAALLAYPRRAPDGSLPDPAGRAHRLIERARRAGLLQAAGRARTPSRNSWWTLPRSVSWAGAAVAAVLVAAVVLRPWQEASESAGGDSTERGASLQVREADDPPGERNRLQNRLRAAGLAVAPYERLGRSGLDIDLPQPLTPPVIRLLREQGLAAPAGPVLRVEFTPRPASPATAASRRAGDAHRAASSGPGQGSAGPAPRAQP